MGGAAGKPSKKGDAKVAVVTAQDAAAKNELNSTTRSESAFPVDGGAAAPRAAETGTEQQAAATDQGWRPAGMPEKCPTPPAEPKDSSPRSPQRSRVRTPEKAAALQEAKAISSPAPAAKSPVKSIGLGLTPLTPAGQAAAGPGAEKPTETKKTPVVTASSSKAEVKEASPGAIFDVSADDFTSITTQAFGPMIPASLTSTKWDKRVNALKGVATVLKGLSLGPTKGSKDVLGGATAGAKGLQLRDNAQCFKAACLVLQRAMRDKVLPVLLASHELFREAFEQAKGSRTDEELKEAMNVLLPHAMVKLGDTNIRLHDSAKEVVNYCAEQSFFGLSHTLELLRNMMNSAGRGHSRAKTLGGVVDTVNMLVEQFPGKRMESHDDDDDDVQMWSLDAVFPFIEAGLDDIVGPRTRTIATKLAVIVHSTLGKEALEPLLQKVRPAIKNLLVQKFQEEEGNEDEEWEEPKGPLLDSSVKLRHEDTMGLVLCGTSCKINSQMDSTRDNSSGYASSSTGPVPLSSRSLIQSSDGDSPSKFSDREEFIMDEILEEVGMVFGKADKVQVDMDDEILGLGIGLDGPSHIDSGIECY